MKPLNFPLIKLTLFFLLGVITGFYVPISLADSLLVLASVFLFFLFGFFYVRKQLFQGFCFGVFTFLMMIALGVFVTKFHSPKTQSDHYINLIPSENQSDKSPELIGTVIKILNPSAYYSKYIVELDRWEEQRVEGKILLNLDKKGSKKVLAVDDKLVFQTELIPIKKPRNPHQFNYQKFMGHREVYRQVYLSSQEFLVLKSATSYLGQAETIREKIVNTLKEYNFSHEQLAMIQALFLGQTRDLTDETYDNYAAAGVIHILSVSGLHVGFVLLILNFVLKPLEKFKFGKFVKVLLLLIFLWGFALLAGFSAPVVRSVAMFSFVALGLNWKRKTHILNILFMSLFAILLFAPQFIFEIGFQLSYLAVFSIVIFQPVFYKCYRPRNWIGKFFWGTTTVTFAAQIGVLPLALYYFHQFPGMFFVSNLLVVPYVGVILGLGMLVVLLAFLNLLPSFLADIFGYSIDLLNLFVAWCAQQEAFLFQNIPFSASEMLASYLAVFCLLLLAWKFNYEKLMACAISLIVLLMVFVYEKRENIRSNQFLVFHKNRKTMLGFKHGKHFELAHNLSRKNIANEYSIRNFMTGEAITKISTDSLENIYSIDHHFLLIVDSLGVYRLPKLKNSWVLLRNSPQINLKRLIQFLHPAQIIADGSNYHSYAAQWRKTCARKNIPFHYTRTDGAFVAEY